MRILPVGAMLLLSATAAAQEPKTWRDADLLRPLPPLVRREVDP